MPKMLMRATARRQHDPIANLELTHMNHFSMHRCLVGLVLLGATSAMASPAAPVVLTKPDWSSHIVRARMLDADKLCLVGRTMDPDGDAQARGLVVLFSIEKNKVLWQKTVDAPDDNAASYFVACASDGKNVYVGANVDTHSERTLNQTLAYVYRFDDSGKTISSAEVVTGSRDALVYDIDVDAEGATVVGFAADTEQKKRSHALFIARYTSMSKAPALTKLATGGFLNGAVAKLAGKTLYIGGNFAPASTPADAVIDDYAVSKIIGSKYQFSMRPLKTPASAVATSITRENDIVSLGYAGKSTTLTVVGVDGKAKQPIRVASAYCQTKSLSANAGTVFAVRMPCGEAAGKPKLVAMNRTSGIETVVKGIVGEPVHVLALDSKLVVVAERPDYSLVVQTLAGGW